MSDPDEALLQMKLHRKEIPYRQERSWLLWSQLWYISANKSATRLALRPG
jgi:hypothetical protein